MLTPAGSTFPLKKDPNDRNLRLAPSMPPLEQLDTAMKVFAVCVLKATIEALEEGAGHGAGQAQGSTAAEAKPENFATEGRPELTLKKRCIGLKGSSPRPRPSLTRLRTRSLNSRCFGSILVLTPKAPQKQLP